jgi:hypothetical protein
MLRANSLDRLQDKRTLRGIYIWHQATPYACFLDTASVGATVVVLPGMVATKTTGEQMAVCNGSTVPFGLFANFIHGAMDELGGGTEISVYRGGPDATFEVLAGPSSTETPLDSTVTWTGLNATAGGVALRSDANGRLTNAGAGGPNVARLVEAVSNSKIVITLDLRTGSYTT